MFRPLGSIVFRAFQLGVASGMRSQIAAAAFAWHQPDAPRYARWRKWPILRNVWGRRSLMLAGAGELIGDKLPSTPSRIAPAPLFGRLMIGVLGGVAIGSEGSGKGAMIRGAIAGIVGAAAGSFGGYHARKAIAEATGAPDPAVAVAEDVIAITLAAGAVRGS